MKRAFLIIFFILLAFITGCSDYSFTITGTWVLQSGTWDYGGGYVVDKDTDSDVEYITLGNYGFCRRDARDQDNTTQIYDVSGSWTADATTITFTIGDAPFSGTVTYNYVLSGEYLTIYSDVTRSHVFKKQW